MLNDEIKLVASGKIISGWSSILVRQGIELFPNQFELSLTEFHPNQLQALRVNPGDYCELKCGDKIMVAGYIDRYFTSMAGGSHLIRLSGRGKCQDMLDCSAEWPGNQFSYVTAKDLAEKLVLPYGKNTETGENHPIKVICDVEDLHRVPQLNMIFGESPYEVIDRVTRYSSLLLYENSEGDLVLARAGTESMASGFEQGVNVQQATIEYGADQRFSEYGALIQSIMFALDGGDAGNELGGSRDPGVKRNRKRYIIAEATVGFQDVTVRRAIWERNRRNGKSEVIKLTTDTWHDKDGNLWQQNKLVSVYLPALKMEDKVSWLISEVVFRKNSETGTTADLTIMHPKAFDVKPMNLEQSNLIDTSKIHNGTFVPYWDNNP